MPQYEWIVKTCADRGVGRDPFGQEAPRSAEGEGILAVNPARSGSVDFVILNADRVGPLTVRSSDTCGDVGRLIDAGQNNQVDSQSLTQHDRCFWSLIDAAKARCHGKRVRECLRVRLLSM